MKCEWCSSPAEYTFTVEHLAVDGVTRTRFLEHASCEEHEWNARFVISFEWLEARVPGSGLCVIPAHANDGVLEKRMGPKRL